LAADGGSGRSRNDYNDLISGSARMYSGLSCTYRPAVEHDTIGNEEGACATVSSDVRREPVSTSLENALGFA
jgi:hypothetical protein